MSRSRAVGIDLGTTYSAASWLDDSGKTAMIINSEGDVLTPSVVLFEDQEVVVGKDAKKSGPLKPARFAECVKRDMGSPVYSRTISGEYMPPEVIQAWVLKKLKADIVRSLGPDFRAVITVPAFFDEPRRKATADAGAMAALPVLDVVNEPTAAALAFGEVLGYLAPSGDVLKPLKVLVYDLGGGTFDVTILDMRPGHLLTLATDGDVRLGGRDWDHRLVDHVADAFVHEHREDPRTNPASLQRLLNEVEEAKRTLSARQQATIRVDHAGSSTTVKVTRERFEQLTDDLLERTAYTTRQVLSVAGLTWTDINRILLVGGATRMPMVGRMLEGLSGIKPDQNVHPDEAVARGAAVYAGYLISTQPDSLQPPAFTVTNVNSHSLGIEGVDPKTSRKRNAIVIPRNTPLPAKVKERFVTKMENQRSIVVQVLEGESAMPSECTTIGRTALRDLPHGLPAGWPVEITYEYGANGRLKVSAVVPGANREVKLELEREGALSDERLARWKQAVSTEGGLDMFAEIIGDELKATQPSSFTPVGNADHVTRGLTTGATGPAPIQAGPAQPTLLQPSSATTSFTTGPAHKTPGTAVPEPGMPGTTAASSRPVPVHGTPPMRLEPARVQATAVASLAPTATASPVSPRWSMPVSPHPGMTPIVSDPLLPPSAAGAASSAKLPAKRGMGAIVTSVGFVISAIAGLILGYYILCYLTPEGNFLGLPPGWFPWKTEAPASPTGSFGTSGATLHPIGPLEGGAFREPLRHAHA